MEERYTDRLTVILGTSHRLQGAERCRCPVTDPSYSLLLETLISDNDVNFIFEEATGLGPTTAEQLAIARWGAGRYLDVDPPAVNRQACGISTTTGSSFPINPYTESRDIAQWEHIEEHTKREEIWLQKVIGSAFDRALIICGCVHMLSFAIRLQSAGFSVKAVLYLPFHKLA